MASGIPLAPTLLKNTEMKDIFQSFTLNEGLTITIALFALVVSIASFFNTSNRDKRQLRIGRIEEMIEIIHILIGNYQYYNDTFFLQKKIRDDDFHDESEKTKIINLEKQQVEVLQNISNEINLREKLIRISVLANTYLPNKKLRNKIRSLIALFTSLMECTVNRNFHLTKGIFSTYPKLWILLPFIEEIQSELIKEMNLGYYNNIFEENPFDEEFKKRMQL